jgi:hypothetical protein
MLETIAVLTIECESNPLMVLGRLRVRRRGDKLVDCELGDGDGYSYHSTGISIYPIEFLNLLRNLRPMAWRVM